MRTRSERGQAIIMVTIGVTFLMGLLGVVVDIGYGYYIKQQAQAAVDSAVIAAAVAARPTDGACSASVLCQTNFSCPPSPTSATNFGAACQYAAQNGFGNATGRSVVLSSGTGPVGGANVNYWVTATATEQLPMLFSRVLGYSTGTVAATATGAVTSSGGAGGCIYVLDTLANGALNISGSANIFSNCGIYVNSSSSSALISSGGAKTTASVVDVVGNVSLSGGSTITPTPTTGVTAAADPLANLPAPTFSGCDATSKNISVITTTLNPGVYCNGITISGGATVTFNSGNYILNGGGLNVSGNSSISGSGVFFYNTSSGYTFKPLTLSGAASVDLTAPTSGTYQGILFFQDRTITSSASNTFSGGANSAISGSIYMPTAQLYFSGGATTAPLTMALVCKDLNVSGNAYLAKDSTGTLTGMGSTGVAFVQ
jgi:Flp pilus assembly protein TadG